jgi:2-polyprenyl-3-methyl-5-hydroxy-6-metoxy-1,4-benzoquinol methylase
MAGDRRTPRTAARTAVVWEVLRDALAGRAADVETIHVLDIGGGTGGFAVPLAELGYRVTVVDPSPDSLAALERRAAEAGVAPLVAGIQGDAVGVVELLGTEGVDAVVCHSVLEVVDDPAEALRGLAAVLRPGGVASVLAANRIGATIARVAVGRLAEARELIASPEGTVAASDSLRRRFSLDQLTELITTAGLTPRTSHGVRVFADHAPQALLDIDPQALEDLIALEHAAADDPAYTAVASALHVLADKA